MPGTQKPISQVASTERVALARFALQMADQARKFGARVAELREKHEWKQRDLVARMNELGDQAINTNQLSRYENGGAFPHEGRQTVFAEALETTVHDLMLGPEAERKAAQDGDLGKLSPGAGESEAVAGLRQEVADLRTLVAANQTKLLAELARLQTAQASERKTPRRPGRSQGDSKK